MTAKKKATRRPSRSNFEQGLMDRLDRAGIKFGYETETFPITLGVVGAACAACGERKRVYKTSRYTPDFFFPNWIIEAKGKFTARDRKRVMALLAALAAAGERRRFALLFMRDNKLSKTSKLRYSDWCVTHGIPHSVHEFKGEWLK